MAKQESSSHPTITETRFVVRLREALLLAQADAADDPFSPRRDALQRQVDIAAEPLIRRCFDGLRGYCDSLARTALALKEHADGDDIAQDAWTNAMRYLKTDRGARIQDDGHFFRFLRVSAKRRFLDIRERFTESLEEGPSLLNKRARDSQVEFFTTLSTDRSMEMIELLFTDEDGFRGACRKPVRRRLMHYRGLVLYYLGRFLDSDGVKRDEDGRGFPNPILVRRMRQYAETLGIEAPTWLAVEAVVDHCADAASSQPELDAALLDTVNQLCGSSIKPGNNLSVLRTEMNGFLSG